MGEGRPNPWIIGLVVFLILAVIHISMFALYYPSQFKHQECAPTNTTTLSQNRIYNTSHRSPQTEKSSNNYKFLDDIKHDHAWTTLRLPPHVLPLLYNITLHPNMTTDAYAGHVDIVINVTMATDYVIVHAHKLNITSSRIVQLTGAEFEVEQRRRVPRSVKKEVVLSSVFGYPKNQFWILHTEQQIQGLYRVEFDFKGSLRSQGLDGIYKTRYVDTVSKENRYVVTTKFEPTYARRAFPCLDEPGWKTPVSMNIIHEPRHHALSNMPAISSAKRPSDGLIVTRFEQSVPMTTYLICIAITDYAYVETQTADGKPFRVWSSPDQLERTGYALKIGSKIQDYFASYYDIPYPLPKQDMIAFSEFTAGAMEHWGIISFRDSYLLVDDRETSSGNLQKLSTVISHELAHMWFGNLVTMEWWDDLWLNEGFASYVEYKGVDFVHPNWHMMDQFLITDMHKAMALDSLKSSHPIIQPVQNPDQINEIFDTISYSKGSSVLRMLESVMGEENFRHGIQTYLKKHEFKHARTTDLWRELNSASKIKLEDGSKMDVAHMMDTWTRQMGFPLVSVTGRRNDDGSLTFTATQQRFLSHGANQSWSTNATVDSPFGYMWKIPLTYRILNTGQQGIIWLSTGDKSKTFTIGGAFDRAVVKFNNNQTGFYRVNYDINGWALMTNTLINSPQVFTTTDRANLINDVFSLASSGFEPYDLALNLSLYLKAETEFVPWDAAANAFDQLSGKFHQSMHYGALKKYVEQLATPLLLRLGWEDVGDHLTRLLRVNLINLLCSHDEMNCLTNAQNTFRLWLYENKPVAVNFKSSVYRYGMMMMSLAQLDEAWHLMWNRYLETQSVHEKNRILLGLASAPDEYLLGNLIELAKNTSVVPASKFLSIVSNVARNQHGGVHVAWDFVREQWPYLVKRFTLNARQLGSLLKTVTQSFSTKTKLREMADFYLKNPDAGATERARRQSIERVKENMHWMSRNGATIEHWLKLNNMMK